ncbi:aldo/keto reductase, partial [Patescibacteria group bacterium]|nr:aldo/keto reductase [Patescibacteria group bacterium]
LFIALQFTQASFSPLIYAGLPAMTAMYVMDELEEEGLTKNIGVSNFTVKQMQRAQKATKNKIVVNQVHYNLMIREAEDKGILKHCQENDILLMAWRPLQKGEILKTGGDILADLANKYKKTPAQIALNWLTSQKNVIAISKTRSKKHLGDNLGSVDWKMDEKDVEYLRNEFPNQQKVSDVSVLKEWDK